MDGRQKGQRARSAQKPRRKIDHGNQGAATPERAARQSVSRRSRARARAARGARCFGAFGFEGTSTRAIAERAGVSHPLLIYHFESKDQLWRSMMEDVLNHYLGEMRKRFAHLDSADPSVMLRAFIENFVRYSARVPQLHRIMTQESTQAGQSHSRLVRADVQDHQTGTGPRSHPQRRSHTPITPSSGSAGRYSACRPSSRR